MESSAESCSHIVCKKIMTNGVCLCVAGIPNLTRTKCPHKDCKKDFFIDRYLIFNQYCFFEKHYSKLRLKLLIKQEKK